MRAVLALCSVLLSCASESANTGQPPHAANAAREEQVQFAGDALLLEGTLALPNRRSDELCPAVVLIHGSGPNSRDQPLAGQLLMQFGFTLPVFSLLTRALTDAGFAVLRFDKRSCGQFNNCSKAAYPLPSADLTIQTFVSDVRGALDYLEQRPEIDPNRIALIGHSEGASYVPTLLQERPATLAGVLLAAPFSAFDTILRNQLAFSRQILTEYGLAEPQIEAELKQVSELSAELDQLRVGAFQGNQIAGIGVGFWSSLLSLGDEAPRILNEVAQPVLLVGGDYDWNVPPSELQHWRTALAARDSNRTTIRSLVCMTHALNCISQADHRQIQEADISRELHPELATTLLSILE